MGLQVPDKNKKAATKAATAERVEGNAKAKAEAQAQAPVQSNVEDTVLDSKRKTLIFVAPLEDPSIPDTTDITVNGKKEPYTTGLIVGYRFKSTEDIMVPDCGLDVGFKQDKMNYINAEGTRAVKAGEEFDLTPFEMAMLLSRPEYNTYAEGGENPVKCVYNFAGAKNKEGAVMKANKTPRASLRGLKTPVKIMPMIKVLSFTSEKGENGATIKNRTIVPGFEKWAPLCERAVRKGGAAGSATSAKKVYNENAQTFLNLVRQKK